MKKIIVIVIATLAVVGIGYSAIKAPSVKDQKIKVGVILPLSGQYASLGESDRNAMILAKDDLKADNIELFFEDDKYDAKTAVSAYQKLRSIDHVDALVVLSAPSIQAIKPLTDADNIPLLGLGETIVHEKDSVFQVMPLSDTLFPTLGKIYGEKYKNIAIAQSNASLFADNAKAFKKGLPADVVSTDIILNPATDYRTEVQKIIALKSEAVTIFFPKDDAIKFLKALRVQDPKGSVKIVCDFGTEIATADYEAAIGKDRLEGCMSTNIGETAMSDFKNEYKARFGSDAMITADFSYDAVGIVKKLAESNSKDKWISSLSSPSFEYRGKASGTIKFNDDGSRFDNGPAIHQYVGGKFVDAK